MNKIWVITGKQGVGKTAYLEQVVIGIKEKGFRVGGFLAEGTWKNNKRDRFHLLDLKTNQRILFCRADPEKDWLKLRHFYINPAGQQFGEAALDPANLKETDLVIIDEIGPFELQGKGWAGAVEKLLDQTAIPMIWAIREGVVREVLENWDIHPVEVFQVGKTEYHDTIRIIADKISPTNENQDSR